MSTRENSRATPSVSSREAVPQLTRGQITSNPEERADGARDAEKLRKDPLRHPISYLKAADVLHAPSASPEPLGAVQDMSRREELVDATLGSKYRRAATAAYLMNPIRLHSTGHLVDRAITEMHKDNPSGAPAKGSPEHQLEVIKIAWAGAVLKEGAVYQLDSSKLSGADKFNLEMHYCLQEFSGRRAVTDRGELQELEKQLVIRHVLLKRAEGAKGWNPSDIEVTEGDKRRAAQELSEHHRRVDRLGRHVMDHASPEAEHYRLVRDRTINTGTVADIELRKKRSLSSSGDIPSGAAEHPSKPASSAAAAPERLVSADSAHEARAGIKSYFAAKYPDRNGMLRQSDSERLIDAAEDYLKARSDREKERILASVAERISRQGRSYSNEEVRGDIQLAARLLEQRMIPIS